jgi:hypothetical protein
MADQKITALTATTTLALTDILPVVTSPGASPETKKITLDNLNKSLAVWTAYAPTWTASGGTTTLGNGTLTGRYIQVGKLVVAQISMLWGSTTSCTGTTWFFTAPVTANNVINQPGSLLMYDASAAYFTGIALLNTSGTIQALNSNGALVTGTAPFTWTNPDTLILSISYEAA